MLTDRYIPLINVVLFLQMYTIPNVIIRQFVVSCDLLSISGSCLFAIIRMPCYSQLMHSVPSHAFWCAFM